MTDFKVIKSAREIENLYNNAQDSQSDSLFPGMTYEDGIMAAIDWLVGRAEHPMNDEEK